MSAITPPLQALEYPNFDKFDRKRWPDVSPRCSRWLHVCVSLHSAGHKPLSWGSAPSAVVPPLSLDLTHALPTTVPVVSPPQMRFAGMMQYDGDLQLPKHFLVRGRSSCTNTRMYLTHRLAINTEVLGPGAAQPPHSNHPPLLWHQVPPPLIERASEQYVVGSGLRVFACSESQKIGGWAGRQAACGLCSPRWWAVRHSMVFRTAVRLGRQAGCDTALPPATSCVHSCNHSPCALLQATSPSSGMATAAGTWIQSWKSFKRCACAALPIMLSARV